MCLGARECVVYGWWGILAGDRSEGECSRWTLCNKHLHKRRLGQPAMCGYSPPAVMRFLVHGSHGCRAVELTKIHADAVAFHAFPVTHRVECLAILEPAVKGS